MFTCFFRVGRSGSLLGWLYCGRMPKSELVLIGHEWMHCNFCSYYNSIKYIVNHDEMSWELRIKPEKPSWNWKEAWQEGWTSIHAPSFWITPVVFDVSAINTLNVQFDTPPLSRFLFLPTGNSPFSTATTQSVVVSCNNFAFKEFSCVLLGSFGHIEAGPIPNQPKKWQ